MTTHPTSTGQAPVATRPAASQPRSTRGRDIPTPPRRYSQWAATILFVLVTMLAAGWLWQQKSEARIPNRGMPFTHQGLLHDQVTGSIRRPGWLLRSCVGDARNLSTFDARKVNSF